MQSTSNFTAVASALAGALPAAPGAAAAGGTYFTDQKKGEVNELKLLLRNVNVERDPKRRRDVIKKVIAYMTLGVDVSRLFTGESSTLQHLWAN